MLREAVPFVSAASNRNLVSSALADNKLRVDGRSLLAGRPLALTLRRHEGAASAELRMGRTRALAEVSGELVQPFPDRPSEGLLQFNVEFSPLASEAFEPGRPPPAAIELVRLIERAVRESQALDTEALCVINGERVWLIRVDVTIMDHDGHLTDDAVIETMVRVRDAGRRLPFTQLSMPPFSPCAQAALQHFRRPEVSAEREGGDGPEGRTVVTVHHSDERPTAPLPLHHVPLAVTFALVSAPARSDFQPPSSSSSAALPSLKSAAEGMVRACFGTMRSLCGNS